MYAVNRWATVARRARVQRVWPRPSRNPISPASPVQAIAQPATNLWRRGSLTRGAGLRSSLSRSTSCPPLVIAAAIGTKRAACHCQSGSYCCKNCVGDPSLPSPAPKWALGQRHGPAHELVQRSVQDLGSVITSRAQSEVWLC